jgi:phosphotriesterase-related protein
MISRRAFVKGMLMAGGAIGFPRIAFSLQKKHNRVMTVKGWLDSGRIGNTLIHEHILVDFAGAAETDPSSWNDEEVITKMLPFLRQVVAQGCSTMVECTPNYLGRDVALLRELSDRSKLNIITNTGYYGGSDHKFLPPFVFNETPEQLSARWILEWEEGIEGTGVRPGFIKISVNPGSLSEVSAKLITAAALTHLKSGLTIASHTGPYVPALEQIDILRSHNVDPAAFIWVHAQNEKDPGNYLKAAAAGAWVSLDGLSDNNLDEYRERMLYMKKNNALNRTLISHDAGWYDPAQPGGGEIRPYTTLFGALIPALRRDGFTNLQINQLITKNPQEAFSIRVRKTR